MRSRDECETANFKLIKQSSKIKKDMIEFFAVAPFVLIFITYIFYFIFRKKIKLDQAVLIKIKRLHFVILVTAILLFVLSLYDIFLNSIWMTKAVAWFYLLTGLFLINYRKQFTNSLEIFYFNILFYAPISLVICWVWPMLAAVVYVYFSLLFHYDPNTIIHNDENFILKYEEGFLVYDFDPTLYEKNFLFMNKIQDIELKNWNFKKDLDISRINENSIKINFGDTKNVKHDTIIALNKK